MRIFVSIASYRDPQLIPTIDDCLAKARFPERLRFGICWQHGPEEKASRWFDDGRFKILDVGWRESKGACWARAEIMKLWEGEELFLQLDSHHRFVRYWDTKVSDQLAATGSPKPILTTYAAPFTSGDPDSFPCGERPTLVQFDRFSDDGIVLVRPCWAPDSNTMSTPVRSRFLCAHFCIAPGSFVEDVPYDPDLYFMGEEITLAVRAFTHGYDLYHPTEIIVWHEYTRSNQRKHWDDHTSGSGVKEEWHQRDSRSRKKVRSFLQNPYIGLFGCGRDRSLSDYEAYAGLSFARRRVQDYTRYNLEPPNPPIDVNWAQRIQRRRVRITIDASCLSRSARSNSRFWYVGVHDASGREIYRKDVDYDEVQRLLASDPCEITLIREFDSMVEPASWTVWPYSQSAEWLEQVTGPASSESMVWRGESSRAFG